MLGRLAVLAVVSSAFSPPGTTIGRRPRHVATKDELSLFDGDADEILESMEEALVKYWEPETVDEDVDWDWDRQFWHELDAPTLLDQCERPQRLAQFFRAHRLMCLTLTGRNHTDISLRRGMPVAALEADGPTETDAFLAYPDLASTENSWPFLPGLMDAAKRSLSALHSAFDESDYDQQRTNALYVPQNITEQDRKDEELITTTRKMENAKETFETTTGSFEKLGYDDEDEKYDELTTDESIEASFAALDRLDRAEESKESLFGDILDDAVSSEPEKDLSDSPKSESLFGDLSDDDVFAGLASAGTTVDGELDLAMPKKKTTRVLLSSYFRHDQLAAKLFPDLLSTLPPSPRHATAMLLRPGDEAPLTSHLHGFLTTCYLRLQGDSASDGVRVAVPSSDDDDTPFATEEHTTDVVMVDAAVKQGLYNSGTEDAVYLVIDYWHPDLEPGEIAGLERFLTLDEQFALRRYPPQEVLPIIFETPRDMSYRDLDTFNF